MVVVRRPVVALGQRRSASVDAHARQRRGRLGLDVHDQRHVRHRIEVEQRRRLRVGLDERRLEVAPLRRLDVLEAVEDLPADLVAQRLHGHDVLLQVAVPVERDSLAMQGVDQEAGHDAEALPHGQRLVQLLHRVQGGLRSRAERRLGRPIDRRWVQPAAVGQVSAGVDEIELLARPGQPHPAEELREVEEEVAVLLRVDDVAWQQHRHRHAMSRVFVGEQAVPGEVEEEAVDGIAARVDGPQSVADRRAVGKVRAIDERRRQQLNVRWLD